VINYDFVNAVENAAHPENLRSYEHRIYEKLSFGEKNAVQAFELAADLGILPRDINAIIRRMRKKGIYICSSQLGYFLPENPEELKMFIENQDTLRAKIKYNLVPMREFYLDYLANHDEGKEGAN